MNRYVGITVGPIFDTIDEAVSPAGLWLASMMFSDISEIICYKLSANTTEFEIIAPQNIQKNEAMYGTYSDRIIAKVKDNSMRLETRLNQLIDEVICDISKLLKYSDDNIENYLKEYIQINYVVFETDSILVGEIFKIAHSKLNAIEWMKKIPDNSLTNVLIPLFRGSDEEKRNENIKKTELVTKHHVMDSPLCIKNKYSYFFKSINQICDIHPDYKKTKYFAVVYGDVDSVEDYLSTVKDIETLKTLTECRTKFVDEISKKIKEFNGITIYAGGDDIFFLSPVEGLKKDNIIKLCYEIKQSLDNCFSEVVQNNFGMSFGISIQYEKYPLSQAINNARNLLFDVCKAYDENGNKKNETRNSMAISFQKHSGSKLKIRISNDKIDSVLNLLDESFKRENVSINSVIKALEYHVNLINRIDSKFISHNNLNKEMVKAIFDNYYDHENQQANLDYYQYVIDYYCDHILESRDKFDTLGKDRKSIDSLLWILKYNEFLLEGEKI